MTAYVQVGDVLTLQRRAVAVEPTVEYREIGVRSFGRGLFHKEPLTGAALAGKRVFRIESGDLVLSNVFAWEGAVALASAEEEGRVGSHRFMTFTPSDGRIDTSWARWWFLSPRGLALLRSASPGSAGRNRTLSVKRFEQLEIPLPPIDEQHRVAARLTRLAADTREVRDLHQRQRAIAAAVLDCVVADTFTAEDNHSRYLGEDVGIISGATPDSTNPAYWDGDINWVTPTDLGALNGRYIQRSSRRITSLGFHSSATQLIPAGAVVMSSRAPIGHLAITQVPICTNQGCKTFVPPDDIQSEYLYWALRAALPRIRGAARGTTFQEVSAAKLRSIAIPVPHPIRQESIARHLNGVYDLMSRVTSILDAQAARIDSIVPASLNESFVSIS